ncbi:hypothetical protein OSG_eHP14_00235 [environmental Halophage eHP-14]|nr:hypothetical protein OSG_eHP14_00235 [environmental Halophage eHP-14]
MSTAESNGTEQFESDILSLIRGGSTSRRKAERIFDGLVRSWGLPTTRIGPDAVRGSNISLVRDKVDEAEWRDEDETWMSRQFGHKRPFMAASAAGFTPDEDADHAATRAYDDIQERATVDATSQGIKGASPVEVDPEIVQTLRTRAPLPQRLTTQAQAGFQAQYNVISSRSDPIGMVSESDAVDLSGNTPQDFGLGTETKDMEIYVDLVEISDFTARAEDTLNYMDVMDTTLGQRMVEHALFKSKQLYYGDPNESESNGSVEDSNAYPGMAVLANDASGSYVIDKSGTSSGFLEDIKSELTTTVENSGLTYDAARIAVSPTMFDALENEANAVTRLTGYDADIEFGGRSIQIKGVEVFEDPNIRSYGSLDSSTTGGGDNGDVFIYDSRNLQFRELAPLSTMPLGAVGLGDRAALFEYGRLISKSQGEHIRVLQAYDV